MLQVATNTPYPITLFRSKLLYMYEIHALRTIEQLNFFSPGQPKLSNHYRQIHPAIMKIAKYQILNAKKGPAPILHLLFII